MKSLRMTVEPTGTVKVSAPKRVSDKQIQDFIQSKHEWILKAQDFYAKKHAEIAVDEGKILLHGVGYDVSNEYNKRTYHIDHEQHIIYAKKDLTLQTNLTAFYKAYGKEYLIRKLLETAEKYGLTVAKVSIRGQKTKRGTCSSKKHISLNWKLVKMPHHIAEYVICHELAHLTHMNHSKLFWQEVERLYPDYKTAEQWMKQYGIVSQ